MKEEVATTPSLTKEDIKRAAVLSLHTYEGATSDEWQDQAETLRAGDGGDTDCHEDANLSQMVATTLRELDEDLAENSSRV